MRHLGENIKQKFKCAGLLQTYYMAAKAYRVDEFEEHFQEIRIKDDIVAKYLEHGVVSSDGVELTFLEEGLMS